MKLLKVINEEEGIYELEIPVREEALKLLETVKEDYPYAVLDTESYHSTNYVLNTYANWGEYVFHAIAEDGMETTCIKCGRCKDELKPSRNSSLGIGESPERCFMEEFWAEVIQNKDKHFCDGNNVYYYTEGEGGFCGRRFVVEFEDGEILNDIGLWHRGEVPECIMHLFRKASSKIWCGKK